MSEPRRGEERYRDCGPARRPAGANDEATGTPDRPSSASTPQFLLEYVTFGLGLHYLLTVVVIQFAVLFLDVNLFEYAIDEDAGGTPWVQVAMQSLAAIVFVLVLSGLVRKSGQRSLTPRFHSPWHQFVSVCGYVLASGAAFFFGFVAVALPSRESLAISAPWLLSNALFVVVFATFIAIGYQAQIDAANHPQHHVIRDVADGWLDALSWVDTEPNSLDREQAVAEFAERTATLEELLGKAKTAEGERLAADFRNWRLQFEAHSALSQEMVVSGTVDDGTLESNRLQTERDEFLELKDRIATIGEVTET